MYCIHYSVSKSILTLLFRPINHAVSQRARFHLRKTLIHEKKEKHSSYQDVRQLFYFVDNYINIDINIL